MPLKYYLLQNVGRPVTERKEYNIRYMIVGLYYVECLECRPQWQLRPWAARTCSWGFQYRSGLNIMSTFFHVFFSCTGEGFAVGRSYEISMDLEF
jgi:hypothetical protein